MMAKGSPRPSPRAVTTGTKAMIAAEHPLEAQAAQAVLEAGGNAIDAAVAAFYMTTVVEPEYAGIGGDAFILAYLADQGEVIFINGSGYAPALATIDRYRKLGGIPDAGPFSTSVPGAVSGFDLALRKYGSKRYAELLRPAIEAATRGHAISVSSASNHAASVRMLSKFPASTQVFLRGGESLAAGDVLVQTDLGKTLETIATDGADVFYQGSIARRIAEFFETQQGLIRHDDLSNVRAQEDAPIRTTYKEYEILETPPNSQGIVLLLALNILEGFDLPRMGHNSADYLHVVTEALKLAFADRNQYIADPRFAQDIPVESLLSRGYAEKRRELIRMDCAIAGVAPPGDPRRGDAILAPKKVSYAAAQGARAAPSARSALDGDTSSFSIADPYGNVVSVTHSIAGVFGSGMVTGNLGFVLNNRMIYFGLETDDINALEPGKRVRQTSCPALVLKNGKPFLAWNTPGVDNQPQAMLQSFLNVVEFGMNVQEATEAPTIITSSFRQSKYPQPAPNALAMPEVLAREIGAELTRRGHTLRVSALQPPYFQAPSGAGAVKMVLVDPESGILFGGVSPAKDNCVAGW